jgi:hypothetical protein
MLQSLWVIVLHFVSSQSLVTVVIGVFLRLSMCLAAQLLFIHKNEPFHSHYIEQYLEHIGHQWYFELLFT